MIMAMLKRHINIVNILSMFALMRKIFTALQQSAFSRHEVVVQEAKEMAKSSPQIHHRFTASACKIEFIEVIHINEQTNPTNHEIKNN